MQFRAGRDCTKSQIDQRRFLPVALTLAQRAFASTESFALAEALMVFFFTETLPGLAAGLALVLAECTLAQRAFCAAEILARPAALILPLAGAALAVGAGAPSIAASFWFKASIWS